MAASWLQNDLASLAQTVEHDAAQLADKVVAALVPSLGAELTPLVQRAVDNALSSIPFGGDLTGVANDAVQAVVNDLVAAVENHVT
jgi:hypothetical protein